MGRSLGKRILLIDGDLAVHEDFCHILRVGVQPEQMADSEQSSLLENLVVDSASHGPEGWTRLQETLRQRRPYALAAVALDLAGEWDGVKTVRHLWDEDPGLPVLLCTAADQPAADRGEIVRRLGHIDRFMFLSKPLDETEVRQAVAAQIDRRLIRNEMQEATGEFNRALRQARDEAEAAGQAKNAFMANMGHEIRTPMNAILGFTRLLMKEPLDAQQLEKLHYIHDAGTSLLCLINNILDYSKLTAGKLELSAAPFNLENVLADVLKATSATAREKDIVVRHHIVEAVPRWLRGDKRLLQQVLVSLVDNATKFTDHGTIHLQTTLDEETEQAVTLRMVVTDTGVGIPAERQAVIFDDFSQGDGSSTRQYSGVGLGLSICRQLVDLMGGQIGFRSDPGQGSSFWLTITFQKHDAGKPTDYIEDFPTLSREFGASREEERGGKPHVLVAEDDHLNRILAEMLLTRAGCLVDLAGNGKEALDLMNKRRYNLVLMDIEMPQMGGLQAIEQFRRRETDSDRHLPIVVMTACAQPEDQQRCLDAGADEYVSKPFTPEMLIGTVRRYLPGLVEAIEPTSSVERSDAPGEDDDQPHAAELHSLALHKALEEADFSAMENSAAAIRGLPPGSVSKLVTDHAMRVQLAARSKNLEQADSAVRRLLASLEYPRFSPNLSDTSPHTHPNKEDSAREISCR